MKRQLLFWCDLETTGLKPNNGKILEIAVVITDNELNKLGGLSRIVPQGMQTLLSTMDEFVKNMHTKNGLLDELQNNPGNYRSSLNKISREIIELLESFGVAEITLAGSNPLSDLNWLMRHMPEVSMRLNHRPGEDMPSLTSFYNLDVSVYKIGFPDLFKKNPDGNHRALDDINFSISQHKKMRGMVQDSIVWSGR